MGMRQNETRRKFSG